MEGDGASQNGGQNGGPHVPLTLDAIGDMIQQTKAELAGTLQKLAQSHRKMRRRLVRFVDSTTEVYQRQQTIMTKLGELEAWQRLHDKDHRDSRPPPVVPRAARKAPKSLPRAARG